MRATAPDGSDVTPNTPPGEPTPTVAPAKPATPAPATPSVPAPMTPPAVATPTPMPVADPNTAGSAGDAEHAFQQATNPALGGGAAPASTPSVAPTAGPLDATPSIPSNTPALAPVGLSTQTSDAGGPAMLAPSVSTAGPVSAPVSPALSPAAAPSLAPSASPDLSASLSPSQAPAVAPAAPPTVPGATTTPLDPNGGLLNASILPDANAPDRTKLAQTEFQNYLDQQLPEYQAKLRGAFSSNAAMGRLGSGQLATSVGDLNLAAQRDANAKMSDLTTQATTGTIADRQQALQNAQNERSYEANRSDTAYGQGVNNLNLEDALTNSAFGRALATQNAGQANNPTQTDLLLSQIFGQQATGAGTALGNLVKGNAANNVINVGTGAGGGASGNPADASSGMSAADIAAWLKQHGVGGSTPDQTGGSDPNGDYGVAP